LVFHPKGTSLFLFPPFPSSQICHTYPHRIILNVSFSLPPTERVPPFPYFIYPPVSVL
jgi:hypothetical protein